MKSQSGNKPLISIITPTYNSSKTIERAIKSVINQSVDNFEHIVIDGGSEDETLKIVKKYPKIRWMSELDSGVYDAMNKGIKMSNGKWIYFLGSDDVLYKNSFDFLFKPDLAKSYDVIYGNVIDERTNESRGQKFNSILLYNMNICHQAIIFKRAIFDKIGGFNLKYPIYADWEHNIKWFLNESISKKYIDHKIAFYAAGGLSSQKNDNLFLSERDYIFLKNDKNILSRNYKTKLAKRCVKSNVSFWQKIYCIFRLLKIHTNNLGTSK
jgi:glycosyltransferase involved in cell wall biosynthesis